MASLHALVSRFRASERGIAAVEFALILPLMLTLYMGSVEVSAAISVDKRVSVAAGALGDLVARADATISTATLNDYFLAAGSVMAPYNDTNLKHVVTCLKVTAAGVVTVEWSKGYNGGIPHTINDPYTIPDELKALALDSYIIVSETRMAYQSLFGYVLNTSLNLYHEFFHLPRYGALITVT